MATAITPTQNPANRLLLPGDTSATVLLACSLLLLFGCSIAFASALFSGDQKYMFLALSLALPAVILAVEFRAGRVDVFAPVNFVLLNLLIGVSARTSYIVFSDSPVVDTMLLLDKSVDVLAPGLLVITLGLLSMIAGYYTRTSLFPVHRLPVFNARYWNSYRVLIIVIAITVLALFSTLMFIQKQGMTLALSEKLSARRGFEVSGSHYYAALGYYRWGASLISLAFLVALTWLISQRRKFRSLPGLAVIALGLMTAVFPFLVSNRTQLLSVAVFALLIVHYHRSRISMRTLGTGLVVIITLFALLGALRESPDAAQDLGAQTLMPDIVSETMENRSFLGVSKTAHIVDAVPNDFEYQGGSTFVLWLLAPIPREIWPEKPPIRIGSIVADRVFAYQNLNIGIPPGLIAEVYMNFGLAMVPAMLFLFGLLLRALYESFLPHLRQRPGLLLLYLFVIFPLAFTLPGGDLSGVVIQLVRDLLPLTLVLAFIADNRPATGPG